MRDKDDKHVYDETREQDRAKRRHIKRHPKMKMTGKGMKRFANPKKNPLNG